MKALRILQFSFYLVLVFCVVTFASGTVTSYSHVPFGDYKNNVGDSHTEYAYIQAGTPFNWQLGVMSCIDGGFVSVQAGIGAPVNAYLTRTGSTNNVWVYQSGSGTQTSSGTIQLFTSVTLYMAYGFGDASAQITW
jgi:hypothetical protein